jgi:hypothetical protein
MDSDIARAVAVIDAKIESLKGIRSQLVNLFGNNNISGSTSIQSSTAPISGITATAHNGARRVTRKDAVEQFIRQNGPSTRIEILRGTGIPEGTIAYCLNDKERFRQAEEGRWANVGE